MSAESLAADPREAPPTPRPAGVVDLGRYRGRTGGGPAVRPPPRTSETTGTRSTLTDAVVAPVLVPDRPGPERTEPLTPGAASTVGPATSPRPSETVVIRRFRLGSVLRMAFGFSLCTAVVVIGAGVLLWVTISALGVVANLESLAEDLGWVDVSFDGPALLRAALLGGGILVVAASLLSVVFAEVFNLLSTITGGLRAEVGPAPLTRRERRRIRKALKGRQRQQAEGPELSQPAVSRRGRR